MKSTGWLLTKSDIVCSRMLLRRYEKQKPRGVEVSRLVLGSLAEWRKDGAATGIQTAIRAIQLLQAHSLHKSCMRVWEGSVRAQGLQLPVKSYNQLLKVFSKGGDLSGLKRVWEEMKAFNIQPTAVSLHAFAHCLVKRGHSEKALTGLTQSLSIVSPEPAAICVALSACKSEAAALAYLERALPEGVVRVKSVYEAYMGVYARLGQTGVVEQMLASTPYGADTNCYRLLLTSYSRNNDWHGAKLVWARMLVRSLSPGDREATALLHCCGSHLKNFPSDYAALAAAEDVFAMHRKETNTQHRLYTALMRIYVFTKQPLKASSLYRYMRKHSITFTEPFLLQARLVMKDVMGDIMSLIRRYLDYPVVPADNELDRLRKNIFMVLYPVVVFTMGTLIVLTPALFSKFLAVLSTSVSVLAHMYLLYTKHLTTLFIKLYISFCCLIILHSDLVTASESAGRAWPFQVILIDILLVSRVEESFSRCMVAVVCVYLTLTNIEGAFRFGLYDSPTFASQEQRREVYNCTDLPCANAPLAAQNYLGSILIFLLDYYFTRGFASSLVQEKAKVEASVETAEKIARSLANFDLDSAEDDLADERLPPKLHAAFDNILQNLKLYRPFLPDALFEGNGRDSENGSPLGSSLMPPGTSGEPDGSRIAVVFTDIQSSTAIWEACPDGMKKALKLHNKTIRKFIDMCQGYEVKTIGDAFMVTFASPTDAVDFGLAVQKALVACSWPNDLFDLPLCERDSEGLWGGLRVRVGVHYGEAEAELNAITGRFDYFGNTVNVAARVEAASVGGGVAVTPEVLAELTDRTSFIEIPVGSVSLKGVSSSRKLSIIIPEELRGRRSYVEGQLRTRGTTPKASSEGSHSTTTRVNVQPADQVPNTRLEHIANATVGCVEVRVGNSGGTADYTTVNEGVCRTLHSLDRCGGTVVAVVGSSITVGWNTAKKTSTHFESSLRFASFVLGRRYANSDVWVGLSSGPVVSATVGTHGQRFVTVMGDCVKLSCAMAAAAAEYRTCALFSSSSMTHFFTGLRSDLKNILRPLANWEVRAADKPQTLVVYEISIPRLYDTDLTSMVKQEGEAGVSPTGGEMSWCWSDAYWEAFTAGDQELIERHAPSDPVLSTVRGSAPKVVVLR